MYKIKSGRIFQDKIGKRVETVEDIKEHFEDKETVNGFTYEISEAMRCINSGEIESPVVPWKVTIACSELFDKIAETRKQ